MRVKSPLLTLFGFAACLLVACGGEDGVAIPPLPIEPPVNSEPDFSTVQAEVDRHSVANMAIMIGNKDGVLFRYEKGSFLTSDIVNIASATKLITGLGVWSVVEEGRLSTSSQPQEHIGFWTGDMMDNRSTVTLSQLMSFTSGFNDPPAGGSCQGDPNFTLFECVAASYQGGIDTLPGTVFSYGPEHMQIAGLMAREATGLELRNIIRRNIFDPAGASASMSFREEFGNNPRYSGGMNGSAEDYARVLSAILAGSLVQDLEAFLTDRTAGTQNGYTLPAIENTGLDWHYGFGFWKECDAVPYQPSCDETPIISSPGAFGFLPWIDFDAGYWAILAMKEPIGEGQSPSTKSVQLEQVLQPLVREALGR